MFMKIRKLLNNTAVKLYNLKNNKNGEGLLVFLGLIVIIVVILGIIYAIAPNKFQDIINRVFEKISSWFGG